MQSCETINLEHFFNMLEGKNFCLTVQFFFSINVNLRKFSGVFLKKKKLVSA